MISGVLVASFGHYVFGILLFLVSTFLILLVLVQRGKGGGLTGALGGMGGQSAFGAKAGDTFTYVTIGTAALWIVLALGAIAFLGTRPAPADVPGIGGDGTTAPAGAGTEGGGATDGGAGGGAGTSGEGS